MYVVREKKSKTVLHMVNSAPGVELEPTAVFPGFDPKTMELGRYKEEHLPEEFTIEGGVVKAVAAKVEKAAKALKGPKAAKAAAKELEDLKAQKLAEASRLSFEQRQKLVPDHELLNAALGVYDEKRTGRIQETVKAFRDEYHRYEAALEKAKTRKAVEALKPSYPTRLLSQESVR